MLCLLAETAAAIDEMIANTNRVIDVFEGYAMRNEMPTLRERLMFRFQSSMASEHCTHLALRLFKATGTTGLSTSYPFARFLQDINAGRSHFAQQYELHGRNWAGIMFGQKPRPDYVL